MRVGPRIAMIQLTLVADGQHGTYRRSLGLPFMPFPGLHLVLCKVATESNTWEDTWQAEVMGVWFDEKDQALFASIVPADDSWPECRDRISEEAFFHVMLRFDATQEFDS